MTDESDIEKLSLINNDNLEEFDTQPKITNHPDRIRLFKLLGVSILVGALFCSTKIAKHDILDHALLMSNFDTIRSELLSERGQRPYVKFIPFPHKSLGSGKDVSCNWTTHDVDDKHSYDIIQRAALTEGICVPDNVNLHLFSTAEAIECLSPTVQEKNIELFVSGDSYNKHLFIGLADVLFGRPFNDEFTLRRQRDAQMHEDNRTLSDYSEKIPSFPHIHFVCEKECYGDDKSFKYLCKKCINKYTEANNNSVAVVGSLIHVYQTFGLDNLTQEMQNFLTMSNRIIFNSQPSYQVSKIPKEFRNINDNEGLEKTYHELLPLVAPKNIDQPFLDFFQLTSSCVADNCSYDGGHRSRYINRWKAQLLLNTICDIEY